MSIVTHTTNYITYRVHFTSEYPHLVSLPADVTGEGPCPGWGTITVYTREDEDRLAARVEHVLQSQSNVSCFYRLPRLLDECAPVERISERYANKRWALRQARAIGADVYCEEAANRNGNIYFLVPFAA